jgi:hypothetical protein
MSNLTGKNEFSWKKSGFKGAADFERTRAPWTGHVRAEPTKIKEAPRDFRVGSRFLSKRSGG